MAKALAYCTTESITAIKSVMIQAPGACTAKLFTVVVSYLLH
jgi:hypothetical protein